jgi:hypothetical protein
MILVLLLSFTLVSSLNCSFTVGTLVDYMSAVNCMMAFPYNQTVATHTLVNLRKVI